MKKTIMNHQKAKPPGNPTVLIPPALGYWSWAVGGSGWQFARDIASADDALAVLHHALELGVNWMDTAAVYGVGPSAEIVSLALTSSNEPLPGVFAPAGRAQ